MKTLNENKLNELVQQISLKYFHKPFRHRATFNNRLRTTGGRYILRDHSIEINPKYILEMDEVDYIGIIKHELCHYHLHLEGKGFRHGDRDFKQLLKETGSPRYCKPLPSIKNKKKYMYVCTKCNFIYKRIRRLNTERYRCGKCKGKITFHT